MGTSDLLTTGLHTVASVGKTFEATGSAATHAAYDGTANGTSADHARQ